ncbi:MAG: hypothetical protein HEQ23_02050 [Tepidisphaera sp.]
MPVLPDADAKLIQFCELRAAVWADPEPPIAIGVTPAQAQTLAAKAKAACEAYEAARIARDAAKAATLLLNDALGTLREEAAPLVASVKVAAARNREVYAAARIDPPRARSPLPPPPTPTDISARPDGAGGVTVRFVAPRSAPTSGASFRIMRSVRTADGRSTDMVEIGGVQTVRSIGTFVDAHPHIPQGAVSAVYMVIGRRGGRESDPSNAVSVVLGAGGVGAVGVGEVRRKAAA